MTCTIDLALDMGKTEWPSEVPSNPMTLWVSWQLMLNLEYNIGLSHAGYGPARQLLFCREHYKSEKKQMLQGEKNISLWKPQQYQYINH